MKSKLEKIQIDKKIHQSRMFISHTFDYEEIHVSEIGEEGKNHYSPQTALSKNRDSMLHTTIHNKSFTF